MILNTLLIGCSNGLERLARLYQKIIRNKRLGMFSAHSRGTSDLGIDAVSMILLPSVSLS